MAALVGRSFLGAATCLVAAACESEYSCTDELEPSISVVVRDSVTGAPAATGATFLVREGDFIDSVAFTHSGIAPGLELMSWQRERPGTYDVTVRRQGYRPWVRRDVRVSMANRCHVRPVGFTVRLVPAS